MMNQKLCILLSLTLFLASCTTATQPPATPAANETVTETVTATEGSPMDQNQFANVLSAQVTGQPGAYQFAVEVASPDTGCEQFADWWEVVSEDGQLLYRRILLHSHVDEQPFVRLGGPVGINASDVVYVRAHMNTTGYGGAVLKGTVQAGFEPVQVDAGFGADLERVPPQPEGCAF